jgi:hypothetical protein
LIVTFKLITCSNFNLLELKINTDTFDNFWKKKIIFRIIFAHNLIKLGNRWIKYFQYLFNKWNCYIFICINLNRLWKNIDIFIEIFNLINLLYQVFIKPTIIKIEMNLHSYELLLSKLGSQIRYHSWYIFFKFIFISIHCQS